MLSQSVTEISDTHYELLQAILSFDWFSRLPAEVAAYTEFLVHLTFAKANFFEKIYTSMVVCFRGPPRTSAGTCIQNQRPKSNGLPCLDSLHVFHF